MERSVPVDWIIDKNRPICPQICEQLCLSVAAGQFAPHEKILSVREIAVAAGVNPNTVMRSYELLQSKNIVINYRGIGFNVAENAKEIILEEQKKQFIEEELPEIIRKMKLFGISIEEVLKNS